MKKLTLLLPLLILLQSCATTPPQTESMLPASNYPTTGSVERLSPVINRLIPADAKIEVLAGGFSWAEGPVWVEDGGYLLFSDVPQNTVYKWKEGEGKSVYLRPSGNTDEVDAGGSTEGSNGLLVDKRGQLILCQHGDRRLAVMDAPLDDPQPRYNTIADNWQNKRFNSPNDAAFYRNGDIYFTDPPYGLPNYPDVRNRQIPFNGVYKVNHAGDVTLLTDKLIRPNGIAFSPDYKTLYVANSEETNVVWHAYDVTVDGLLQNDRIFFDATSLRSDKNTGLADGMKVNPQGFIFATGPGGVMVFSPQGEHLGTIHTGQPTANVAFGNDGDYLYMTANSYLMRIRLVNN